MVEETKARMKQGQRWRKGRVIKGRVVKKAITETD